jgi:PAS domain S-box-containing protein
MTVVPNDDAQRVAPAQLPSPWAAIPWLASVISIVVGCLVLIGWQFDVDVLKRAVPTLVAMNPTTAVLFILSGISLGLSLRRTSAFRSWTGQAAAFVVLALAAAKLLQLAAHWPLAVDQWLFAEKLGPTATGGANRMAPNTAAEFALLALAILLLDRHMRKFSPSQTLALLAGFGALLPITGYLYGVRSFEGLAAFIPMAIHTAITCFILCAGVFFARPDRPLIEVFISDDSRGVIARRVLPTIILLTILFGWLRLEGERHGYFSAAFGTALYAVTLCVLFVILIRWSVWTVGKIEEEKNALNDALLENKWRLEESLRETQLIINHARELICTVDDEGKLCTLNAAAEEILGIVNSALLGRLFSKLHAPEESLKIEKAFTTAKMGLTAEIFAAKCQKSDRSYVQLHWSIQWSPHHQRMFCVGRAG